MSNTRFIESNDRHQRQMNRAAFDYTFYAGAHNVDRQCRQDRTLGGNQVSRGQSLVDYESQLMGLTSVLKPYKMGSDARQPVTHLPTCSAPGRIYQESLSGQMAYDTQGKNAPFRYAASV